jgi:cobalt-precorrin 5A hydrolase
MRVAGFGFRSEATIESLRAALDAAGGPFGLTCLATADNKAGANSIRMLAKELHLSIHPTGRADLAKVDVPTHSEKSFETYGTGSVAEASALAAAGENARLLAPRAVSDDRLATCAIAIGGDP